ncbi:helix-turn-helix domain-containing protein [Bradyrhizobium tunisiense]|uniref:helix-turn-helix domain-containing protein n=1 Tax=Bradyrhizobium tunisiense TaxID=3278709 RepID=UPI0035DB151A
MTEKRERSTPKLTFGKHLARLREATGLSLRQVEEASDKEVSNAYLSQLENDKIAKPSPNILHVLSRIYNTSYEDLMERAGYLPAASEEASGRRQARAATFAVKDLTPEEESALIEYLAFIRKQHRA